METFEGRRATVARAIELRGTGLHEGRAARLRVCPAPPGTGRVFIRIDRPRARPIPASLSSVLSTERAVTLGHEGAQVRTVEHLLAALYALDIDDVRLEVEGPELPLLDGSALPFVEALEAAGRQPSEGVRAAVEITAPVEFREGASSARWVPSFEPGLVLSVQVDFRRYGGPAQSFTGRIDAQVFSRDLGPARTFGFLSEVEALRSLGLARGANAESVVVLGPTGRPASGPLRFPDELVRHKALDAVGDLSLLGSAIHGRLELRCAGHRIHIEALRTLKARTDAWRFSDGGL